MVERCSNIHVLIVAEVSFVSDKPVARNTASASASASASAAAAGKHELSGGSSSEEEDNEQPKQTKPKQTHYSMHAQSQSE